MTDDRYTVGAILEGSWGYEQTNINFFKIVKRTNDTLWLQPLATRTVADAGFMSTRVVPGEPTDGKIIRRRLMRRDGEPIGCRFATSYGWINLWDGKASLATHYG